MDSEVSLRGKRISMALIDYFPLFLLRPTWTVITFLKYPKEESLESDIALILFFTVLEMVAKKIVSFIFHLSRL